MKKLISFLFLAFFVLSFSFSFAQQIPTEAIPTGGQIDTSFFNIWSGTGEGGSTCNMLGYTCTFCDALIVAANIIKFLLNIGIILAVVIILYAGIRFMTAGGSEQQITSAKGTLQKAAIGLALVIGAWFIVGMVFSFLTNRDNWNEINPLNCPSSKLKVWDVNQNTNGTNNNNSGSGEGSGIGNKTKKEDYFGSTEPTLEELQALEGLTEGTEVTPITECNIQTKNRENIFQYAFSTPKIAYAKSSGDYVVDYAKKYLGKLKYSNDAKARRDPDGKTAECKNLIQGTNYIGCSDCSGFVFKIFTCVLGEDLGEKINDDTKYVNSAILKTVKLPPGFTRYFTADMETGEEIASKLGHGDVLGYDVSCNKKYNKAKMGHVMIFDKLVYQNNEWFIQMIDQGSDGGARRQLMNRKQEKPFLNCGYIIHIN